MSKTYFVTGGGTGGHIYPAVAIVNELLNSGVKKEEIYYLGNKNNLEYEIATKNGYNFLSYNSKGMPRKIGFALLSWAFQIIMASFKALQYVIKYKPSVVFATGGYVCAPILICAKLLNIPYVLHESDIQPGIVTRAFASGAKNVSIAFEEAKKYIKNKNIFLNGNPIRAEFSTISKQEARKELSLKDEFVILIMGGSLGAKTINDSSFTILKEYHNNPNIKIIWQTGKKNFDDVVQKILEEFKELPDNLILQPYFDRMYLVLLASNVVISRAGSLSLSEICASRLPSILIPYPYASQDHQKKNAQYLVNSNVAIMLEDKDCNRESLFNALNNLINDKEKLSTFAQNTEKLAKQNASKLIVEQINKAI